MQEFFSEMDERVGKWELKRVQDDLLREWGRLEEQVTSLYIWMAGVGHVVTEAVSRETLDKLVDGGRISNEFFDVVDELTRRKERITGLIGKVANVREKFKERDSQPEANSNDDESNSNPIKIEVHSDDGKLSEVTSGQQDLPPQRSIIRIIRRSPTKFGQKGFLCRKSCGVRLTTPETQRRHEDICNGPGASNWNVPVECPICSKLIKSKCMLNYHMRTAHHKPIKREQSQKLSTKKSGVEGSPKPFPCSHCSKSFTSKDGREYHMRSVQGERSYICGKGCGAGFVGQSSLTRHEKACSGSGTAHGRRPTYVAPRISVEK